MTLVEFKNSLTENSVNPNWSVQIQSLWYAGKDEWHKAHDLIDHLDDAVSNHIHAYLHRMEGDFWNAKYWYNRAKKPEFKGSLDQEWMELVELYLN